MGELEAAESIFKELAQGVGAPALPLCDVWQQKYKYDQEAVCAAMPANMKIFCEHTAVCLNRQKVYKAPHLYAKGTHDHLILILPGTGTPPTLPEGQRPTVRHVS